MTSISVKFDVEQIKKQLNSFQRSVLPQATVTALNRAITAERVEAIKQIRKSLAAKTTGLRREIVLHHASKEQRIASMTIHKAGIPLVDFPYHVGKSGKNGTPTTVQEYMNAGQVAKSGAFIMTVHGHTLIAKRKGSSRKPTKQMYGPDAVSLVDAPTAADSINAVGDEVFQKNLNHEVGYRLEKLGFKVTHT